MELTELPNSTLIIKVHLLITMLVTKARPHLPNKSQLYVALV